jgi:hypothetical protein
VAAIALFILAPLTGLFAAIGFVAVVCSKSHGEIFKAFIQSDEAATTIQKHVRGHLARKPHLPRSLYPSIRLQCEKADLSQSFFMPRAVAGKTPVYLPQEMPQVVLKKSGRNEAIRHNVIAPPWLRKRDYIMSIKRFHQMQAVRNFLS